jgi:ankyrin repeat protein
MKLIYTLFSCLFTLHSFAVDFVSKGVDDYAEDIPFEAVALVLIAADCGSLLCLEKLLDAFPVLVNALSTCGSTPLYLATEGNHHQCVELLLKKGATNETDYVDTISSEKGFTALYIAAEFGCVESLMLLARAFSKDIDEKSPNGATPLFAASREGHYECVKILLVCGAKKNILCVDEDRDLTPYEIAHYENHQNVAQLIKSYLSKKGKVIRRPQPNRGKKRTRIDVMPNLSE